MTEFNANTESGRASIRRALRLNPFKGREGEKIPCPYCNGEGINKQNNCECGFCEKGVHTLGT